MSARMKITKDGVADMIRAINTLVSQEVLVGIPEAEANRSDDDQSDGPINNAMLGYIHDNGSPAANIPARPFLKQGVENAMSKVEQALGSSAKAAFDGKKEAAVDSLHRAGMIARDAVKAEINDGDFAPLAESTLQARARRGRKGAAEELKSRAEGNAPNPENARPLVDTGQLRNSINYVVRPAK